MTTMEEAVRLLDSGKGDEAAAKCRALLRASPDAGPALHVLGLAALREGDCRRAIHLIELATTLTEQAAHMRLNLGVAYEALGQFAQAEDQYHAALRESPEFCEAYYNLAHVRKHTDDTGLLPAIRTLVHRGDIPRRQRCLLSFAAGKICDDQHDHAAAFEYYQQGNKLHDAQFDPVQHREAVEDLISVCNQSFFDQRRGCGNPSEVPIFVVGVPRSGTSLVEQVLASHPAVHGAGELYDLHAIGKTLPQHTPKGEAFPICLPDLEPGLFAKFGDAYLRRIRTLDQRADRIVDKMPGNYLLLGLIALLLPQARIIHCRRDPLDTCLSCYFQFFSQGVPYAYNLEHLGFYYGTYLKLMEHWRKTLPVPMLEIEYESLVHEHEATCRRLIEFCGLEWDDRCLEFHKAERPVHTASNWQVRQPLYSSSIGRWRRYEKHLGPLQRELDVAISG